VFTDIDQDVVGLCLSAEAGPGGAEGCMTSVLPAVFQQNDDIVDRARRYDDLWNQAIWAGIGGVAYKVNSTV